MKLKNSSSSPKVSVIMPVYNGEAYVQQTVESILQQTFTDFEFIIINDASTDNSLAIIEACDDPRIIVINHTTNSGQAVAANNGIDAAKGMYIARTDADDISSPGRLAKQVLFMDHQPNIAVCGTWMETFGECSPAIWRYPLAPDAIKCCLLFQNVIAHPSVIMRRDILVKENFRYADLYRHSEDYDLWVNIAQKYDIANIPQALLKYRISHKQVSTRFRQQQLTATSQIQCNQIKALGIHPTREECMLHFAISLHTISQNPRLVKPALHWLNRLEAANIESDYYPAPAFSQMIAQYRSMLCQYSHDPVSH